MIKKLSQALTLSFITLNLCLLAADASQNDPWNGEEYHQNSSSQKDAASDLLKYVDIKGNESILDIGCGDGKITAAIATQLGSGKIMGIDISPSMIEFASNTFPKTENPNLEFKLMSAEEIDFEGVFDTVFSFTTLQWITDHQLVIAKITKSLKQEGVFAATMPMGLPWALENAVNEAIQEDKWKDYFVNFDTGWNFVTANQYEDYLIAQGYTINRLAVVKQEDVFPSVQAFKGFISQWFPYLRPLPKSERETFMNQVLTRYLELDPLDGNGQVHFKINRLEVVAQIAQKNH